MIGGCFHFIMPHHAANHGSYWQGYLGYPAIAFLLLIGRLPYDAALADNLKGIAWKDINQQFKNDFSKTLGYIEATMNQRIGQELRGYAQTLLEGIAALDLNVLGKKVKPPEGY